MFGFFFGDVWVLSVFFLFSYFWFFWCTVSFVVWLICLPSCCSKFVMIFLVDESVLRDPRHRPGV